MRTKRQPDSKAVDQAPRESFFKSPAVRTARAVAGLSEELVALRGTVRGLLREGELTPRRRRALERGVDELAHVVCVLAECEAYAERCAAVPAQCFRIPFEDRRLVSDFPGCRPTVQEIEGCRASLKLQAAFCQNIPPEKVGEVRFELLIFDGAVVAYDVLCDGRMLWRTRTFRGGQLEPSQGYFPRAAADART